MRFSGVAVTSAALLLAGGIPASAASAAPGAGRAGYQVASLASLGGTASSGQSINDRGWVTGFSSLPGNNVMRATLWRNGKITSLGALGGPNSAVLWPVKNDAGIIT